MLDTARRWLHATLTALAPEIAAGVPIVGLEPSCVAVFRDEMRELLPDREDAKRLASQTFLLSEFLNDHHVPYPKLYRTALVHGHCHQRSIMKLDAEEQALEAMGLQFDVLDSGCCGMAGSFGFERDHYDVSMKVGERVLLPAVRHAPKDALIVADGFSCRTQIAQSTDRRALHLADLMEMAVREGVRGPAGDYPESKYVPDYGASVQLRPAALLGGALLGAAVGAAVMGLRSHLTRDGGGSGSHRQDNVGDR
jgi:Fe-S oxidoreductase